MGWFKQSEASPPRRKSLIWSGVGCARQIGINATRMGEDKAMNSSDSNVEPGSGNVFADLSRPGADAHMLKAELVSRIDALVRRRGMTQTEAARLLGLAQPDVSRLLRGDFREYSLERLFRLLTALGRDIDIVIRPQSSTAGGKLRVAAADSGVA